MLKRLQIYFKEMYPIIPRIVLGLIIFFEIYFIVLLNSGITEFNIGIQEIEIKTPDTISKQLSLNEMVIRDLDLNTVNFVVGSFYVYSDVLNLI